VTARLIFDEGVGMAATTRPQATAVDPCARVIRAAQQLRSRIKLNIEGACELRDSITALRAESRPDEAKIRLLEKELATVERQIREDQTGLREFELEIQLNC
jgi:hypothetical protein